jgi:Resolvase, N terminal domain
MTDRATKPAQVAMMMRTVNPSLALQRDALAEAGCGRIFTEQLSGGVADRPALRDTLEFERSGDALILWKLDRLARSVKQLIETIEELRVRGSGFRKPDRSSRHDDGAGPACFSHVCRVGGIRTQPDPGAHPSGPCRRTARWSHGRPSAETDGRRHRGRQGDAGQSRPRHDPNRAPPRRLSRDALSLHPRRENREYLRWLRTPALTPEAERRRRVRGCRSASAMGGFLPFTGIRSGDEVAPIPDLPGSPSAMEAGVSKRLWSLAELVERTSQ